MEKQKIQKKAIKNKQHFLSKQYIIYSIFIFYHSFIFIVSIYYIRGVHFLKQTDIFSKQNKITIHYFFKQTKHFFGTKQNFNCQIFQKNKHKCFLPKQHNNNNHNNYNVNSPGPLACQTFGLQSLQSCSLRIKDL